MISYYVHIPWCRRKCPYCDFYVVVNKKTNNHFADNIIKEYQQRFNNLKDAYTIYFGGGTPSLLPYAEISKILDFFISKNTEEITLEANPEDLHKEYVQLLSSSPINRISLGIQSFDDGILRFLGRKHNAKQAFEAIDLLQTNSFNNISVDLIVGIENENLVNIKQSIDYLHKQKIPHFSLYLLTIEDGSNFKKRIDKNQLFAPNDDYQAFAYETLQQHLLSLGYEQYEISSYGLANYESKHNQVYWSSKDYIGLGPSAHSMIREADGSIARSYNQSLLSDWLKDPCFNINVEKISAKDALKESLAFGLRNMKQGINPLLLANICQSNVEENFYKVMEKFIKIGLIKQNNDYFYITNKGALFADMIMRDILA